MNPVWRCLAFCFLICCADGRSMNCIALEKPQFVFGFYEPLSVNPHDIETQFLLYCQPAAKREMLTLRIGLQAGRGSAGIRSLQGMQYGDNLQYAIYRDPARSLILNDEASINVNESLMADKLMSIPLYGRIFARQNISTDNYQASLLVTLDY